MVDLKAWVDDNISQGFQELIFDRHRLISEPIYGSILRAEPEPGFDDFEWFEARLRQLYKLDPVIIYCLPPFEVVWNNILSGDDNKIFHGAPQRVRAIWGAYFNKAMTDFVLNSRVWVYDYTWDYASATLQMMVANIRNRV